MARRIKDTGRDDIVSGSLKPLAIEHVLFSFRHLTKNRTHSFAFFKNNIRNAHDAYAALLEKMNEVSLITMKELLGRSKQTGFETLFYKSFSPLMQDIFKNTQIVSGDSKLMVFRFCNGKYRMICKPDNEHQSILHVIGFDFDYSAYEH